MRAGGSVRVTKPRTMSGQRPSLRILQSPVQSLLEDRPDHPEHAEAHLVGESALRLIVDQHRGELEGERLTGGVLRRRRAAIAEEHGREEGCLQGADDARRHRGVPQAPPPGTSGACHVDAGQPLEHLEDGRAVLLVEAGRARHLVDLLGEVREQERHAELLGEGGLELLVLEVDVDAAARREVPREHLRRPVLEGVARAGAHPDHIVDRLGIEPGLDAHHERLGHRHHVHLHQHVVDELHRQSLAEPAHVKELGAHRLEEVAAGVERLARAARDDRQLARDRAPGPAAHRRIEHGDAARAEPIGEPPRGEGVDRAHADHDVAGLSALDDAALARDDLLGLRGGLHHHDRAGRPARPPPRARRPRRRPRAKRLGLGGVDVVDDERKAVLDQVLRHRPAHVAEADESHWSGHGRPPQDECRVTGVTRERASPDTGT